MLHRTQLFLLVSSLSPSPINCLFLILLLLILNSHFLFFLPLFLSTGPFHCSFQQNSDFISISLLLFLVCDHHFSLASYSDPTPPPPSVIEVSAARYLCSLWLFLLFVPFLELVCPRFSWGRNGKKNGGPVPLKFPERFPFSVKGGRQSDPLSNKWTAKKKLSTTINLWYTHILVQCSCVSFHGWLMYSMCRHENGFRRLWKCSSTYVLYELFLEINNN